MAKKKGPVIGFKFLQKTFDNNGKKYDSFADFLVQRQAIGSVRYKTTEGSPFRQFLFSQYKKLSDITDAAVAEAVGASIIKSRSGRGVIPDNIEYRNEQFVLSETKSITTITNDRGIVDSTSAIKVGSGRGINLSNTNKLLTGVNSKTGELEETDVDFSNKFLNKLASFVGNSEGAKKWLNISKDPAAALLRKNFETKSSTIYVPVFYGGKAYVRSIGWTWKDIVKNPKANVKVSVDKETGEVFVNIGFTEALVRQALNNTKAEKEIKDFSKKLSKEIGDTFAFLSPKMIAFLNSSAADSLKQVDFEKGSIKGYTARFYSNMKAKDKRSSIDPQTYISSAQMTALVKKAVYARMPKGPVGGRPLSNKILTYRTGRFHDSIKINLVDYKKKVISYFYDPIYRVHEYSRDPRELIEREIRGIVRQLYGRRFNILRG